MDVPAVSFDNIIQSLYSIKDPKLNTSRLMHNGKIATKEEEDEVDPRNAIWIADWNSNGKNNTIEILIVRGDPGLSNPALVTPHDNGIKTVSVAQNQAIGSSCHIIIEKNSDSTGQHRALIEKVSGMGIGVVLGFLNYLLQYLAEKDPKFTYTPTKEKNNPKPKSKPYWPKIRATSPPSANIISDIDNGLVEGVELIKKEKLSLPIDHDDEYHPHSMRIFIKVAPNIKSGSLISKIKSSLSKTKFEKAQLRLKEIGDGSSASPTLSLEEIENAEFSYNRIKKISNFSKPLDNSCDEKINDILTTKMHEIFIDGDWK